MTRRQFNPGDRVELDDPDKYMNTLPGEVYTVTRLPEGFVEIRLPNGRYLTVQPGDLYHA
ncbi:hypothetical protein [Kitasatospora acidiphila]|uniref:hypothetical protein n=1 Tax=Kitasatospora acidiphila TaxID=2567942 RepID=UPI003C787F46